MSSGFLTSNDMNLLQRLLGEVPANGLVDDVESATVLARMLVHAVERGIVSEPVLRTMIASYRRSLSPADALEIWETEGGAAQRSDL